jgi:phenylacetate-CoA ligase
VLTRPGNMDELTVQVEAHESVPVDDRAALGHRLSEQVKNNIGVTVRVEVLDPHALERSLGKAKRIADRRS